MAGPRDPLTAPEDAVPRRHPAGRLTLPDCFRDLMRRRSPRLIAAALAAALAVRVALGDFTWRDPAIAAGLVALQPFTEWVIHVYLLHSRPVRVGDRRVDLPAAREHRDHHAAPAYLDGVLIPSYVIAGLLAGIPLVAWALSFPIHSLIGGPRLAGAATGALAAYAILATYEWCHFLIHTPYVPRGRHYRAIRRSHRLHHYKNERYWFGVTSNMGDRVIGTFPEAEAVPRSATARTLGAAD